MWTWTGNGPGAALDEQTTAWMGSLLDRVRHFPLVMLLPAVGKASTLREQGLARRDGVLTGIALERYRRRHGTWPPALDELVPDLLPAVPPDRFDGAPQRYALIDGAPVVYSIGHDRDDDGGRAEPTESEGMFWSPDPASRWRPPPPAGRAQSPHWTDADWVLWPLPVAPLE